MCTTARQQLADSISANDAQEGHESGAVLPMLSDPGNTRLAAGPRASSSESSLVRVLFIFPMISPHAPRAQVNPRLKHLTMPQPPSRLRWTCSEDGRKETHTTTGPHDATIVAVVSLSRGVAVASAALGANRERSPCRVTGATLPGPWVETRRVFAKSRPVKCRILATARHRSGWQHPTTTPRPPHDRPTTARQPPNDHRTTT